MNRTDQLSHEELQRNIFNILCMFDEFARKNGIWYSLAYGTLLGAVRHKGFIPWDDDIDVWVTRPGFNRIVDIVRRGQPFEHYRFSGYEIDKWRAPFIKLFDTRIAVEESGSRGKENFLWIDIFPLDGVSENSRIRKKQFARMKGLHHLSTLGNYDRELYKGKKLKAHLKRAIGPIATTFHIDQFATDKLLAHAVQDVPYESADYVANLVWTTYGMRDIVEKKWIYRQDSVLFEGKHFPCISEYETWLERTYGDYMTPPPVNLRRGHVLNAYKL